MDVRMEYTEGRGRAAEVWVNGALLTVCDNISPPESRCLPGLLEGVMFGYTNDEAFTWEEAAAGNRSRKVSLDPIKGWRYVGYGQVVQIMPVKIHFGSLIMEDGTWSSDENLVGQFVCVPINRLELLPASKPDWPENMR